MNEGSGFRAQGPEDKAGGPSFVVFDKGWGLDNLGTPWPQLGLFTQALDVIPRRDTTSVVP